MTTYRIAKTLTTGYMLLALALSFTHIADLFGMLGAGWQRWLAPALIDGFALLGQLGRSTKFTPATRRAGARVVLGAGLVSLTCNVVAGHSAGDRIIGGLVVIGFIFAEWYSGKLRPVTPRGPRTAKRTPAAAPAPAAAVKPAKDPARVAAARKAAATRRANTAASTLTHPVVPALVGPGSDRAYI